jgi:Holliday junction resolvase RusA-like endonuclease
MRFGLVIDGPPVSKKNSGRIARAKNGRPFLLPSKAWVRWYEAARLQLRVQWSALHGRPLDTPCAVSATFYRKRRIGDLDNFLAALGDCLQRAGVIENDALIRSFDGSRLDADSKRPRIELTITPSEA